MHLAPSKMVAVVRQDYYMNLQYPSSKESHFRNRALCSQAMHLQLVSDIAAANGIESHVNRIIS